MFFSFAEVEAPQGAADDVPASNYTYHVVGDE